MAGSSGLGMPVDGAREWFDVARDVSGGALLGARWDLVAPGGEAFVQDAHAAAPERPFLGADAGPIPFDDAADHPATDVPPPVLNADTAPAAPTPLAAASEGEPTLSEVSSNPVPSSASLTAASAAGHAAGSGSTAASVMPAGGVAKALVAAHHPSGTAATLSTAEGQTPDGGTASGQAPAPGWLTAWEFSRATLDIEMSSRVSVAHDGAASMWSLVFSGEMSMSQAVAHGTGVTWHAVDGTPWHQTGSETSAFLAAHVTWSLTAQWKDGETHPDGALHMTASRVATGEPVASGEAGASAVADLSPDGLDALFAAAWTSAIDDLAAASRAATVDVEPVHWALGLDGPGSLIG